jgi:hypothetical protein
MKQLLIETNQFYFTPKQINESLEKNSGKLFVEGLLTTAEQKNGNGRYYPKSILEREITKYVNGPIKENRSTGELDHPQDSIINLKNVSHIIRKIYWDGNKVIGLVEILPTPSGNILKELFKSGVNIGISSRALGSVKEKEGILEVQDDLELICWDFVSTPSNPGSFMYPTSKLNEGKINISKNYDKVNSIIRDILCSNGSCPLI